MTRFAALQMTSGPDVAANLAVARRLVREAAQAVAAVALLPENFAFLGSRDGDKRAVAEADGSGPIQDALREIAAESKMFLIAGTFPMHSGDPGGRVHNATLVYDARGERVARYDKIHLFDVDVPGKSETYRESAHVAPGRQTVVIESPAGLVGLSVCYDLRFPELYRRLSAAGAEILVVPSAFTAPTGRAHWEVLLRARAVENLCYVVAAAQSGIHPNGRETYGDSLIVDHWGRVLARLPRGVGVVTADIDLQALRHARGSFPALQHRVYTP